MPLQHLLVVLLGLLPLAIAASDLTVLYWPVAASASPSTLLSLSYNATTLTSNIKSYTPPVPSSLSEIPLVRIGFHPFAERDKWAGVLASSSSFSSETKKLLRIHTDRDGGPVAIGWHAHGTPENGKSDAENVQVEILPVPQGPRAVLNAPVVVNPDGRVAADKPEEKTFLQKYWWMFALFIVVQLFAAGGKE